MTISILPCSRNLSISRASPCMISIFHSVSSSRDSARSFSNSMMVAEAIYSLYLRISRVTIPYHAQSSSMVEFLFSRIPEYRTRLRASHFDEPSPNPISLQSDISRRIIE